MVRIRLMLESETLRIEELKPLIGKTVEITIKEEASPDITAGTGNWKAAAIAVQQLRDSDYDFDAWRIQRDLDAKHAEVHTL